MNNESDMKKQLEKEAFTVVLLISVFAACSITLLCFGIFTIFSGLSEAVSEFLKGRSFVLLVSIIIILALMIFVFLFWFDKRVIRTIEKKEEKQREENRQIFSRVSRDIRTPLTSILGFSEMAEKHMDDQERLSEYLYKIRIGSQNLLSVLGELPEDRVKPLENTAVDAAEPQKAPVETANRKPLPDQDILNEKRILLAEDNRLNLEIAVDLLTDLGVMTEAAENGLEAVKAIREHEKGYYDLILMDIQMPVMDGYEATREIRKTAMGAKIPIFALSADVSAEDQKRSLEAGMNGHLAKPISAKELKDTLLSAFS